MHSRLLRAALGLGLIVALFATSGIAGAHRAERSYSITFENLTDGQPFSPIVAATHRNAIDLFQVGSLASPGIEAIAEDGDNSIAFNALSENKHAYDVVNAGVPVATSGQTAILPDGTVVTDSVSFDIVARPGDRLSLATMLICTNDGFTGLDAVKLPKSGSITLYLMGYDAGTEDNTEAGVDIVDPCGLLGPAPIPGAGNEDAAVDTSPAVVISHHMGILGGGDLTPALHDWNNSPVAKVTITRN